MYFAVVQRIRLSYYSDSLSDNLFSDRSSGLRSACPRRWFSAGGPSSAVVLRRGPVPRLPSRSVQVPGFIGNLHDYETMGAMGIGEPAPRPEGQNPRLTRLLS
jgi:hypothetical protein